VRARAARRLTCPLTPISNSVRAISNTPVWLQAGYYLAIAAQIPAEQKTG
jgi:hypothetical protein